ncbi:MAG: DNA-binding response regulator [Flavobacteriaceae bacterium]|nr:MAG: DNA-binding response regulator [Flavobacteriaceae bacterium]
MNIKCIIIDDEPLASTVIETYLEDLPTVDLVGVYTTAMSSIAKLEEGEVDLVFLDINLPKMTGLDFLRTLHVKPLVVITTAYREYAVESFDLDVLDYLVKPIPLGRFLKSVNKVSDRLKLTRNRSKVTSVKTLAHIFLKVDKKLIKFRLNDILFIESLKDYIKVCTLKGDYLVHKSMTSVLGELPEENFMRIHRSFAIALNKVNCVEGNTVEIANQRIPIGRNYQQTTKQRILNTKEVSN